MKIGDRNQKPDMKTVTVDDNMHLSVMLCAFMTVGLMYSFVAKLLVIIPTTLICFINEGIASGLENFLLIFLQKSGSSSLIHSLIAGPVGGLVYFWRNPLAQLDLKDRAADAAVASIGTGLSIYACFTYGLIAGTFCIIILAIISIIISSLAAAIDDIRHKDNNDST